MALFRPGAMMGQISGSVGATTYSHNRYGVYMRTRATPVKSTTPNAINTKLAFGVVSQLWLNLAQSQRDAWKQWAAATPIINRIGDSQILSPNAAFMRCNMALESIGSATIDLPPAEPAPDAIAGSSVTADASAHTVDLAFSPTPVPADTAIIVYGAVPHSLGQTYVENQLKRVTVIPAAEASPKDIGADWEQIFGTLVAGQRLVVDIVTIGTTTGLMSPRQRLITTVVA